MKTTESETMDKYLSDLLSRTQIGSWDYNIKTGTIVYSDAWAEILGYSVEELEKTPETWRKMVLPEDLPYINEQIDKHMSGEMPIYEAQVRMVCKDGSIIWVQDRGEIIEYDEDGNPVRFIGVLQDITNTKKVEEQLRENQETLDLAVSIAELGTWDWHIAENIVQCNDEYLKMLGYTRDEFLGTIEEWIDMIHQDDRTRILNLVNDYMTGRTLKLQCEMRMKHKDGYYIWTRDMGRIVARDSQGNATRIVGGRLNVDIIKRSAEHFSAALDQLEHHKDSLEKEIENRTKALTEQDKMLWAVNEISQRLFSLDQLEDIHEVINFSLERYCKACGKERIALWKNKTIDNEPHCSLLYEYTTLKENFSFGVNFQSIVDEKKIKDLAKQLNIKITEDEISTLLTGTNEEYIPYIKYLPTIHKYFVSGKNLNTLASSLDGFEKIQMYLRGVKSFLVTPIILNNKVWGFIGMDNCKTEELFSEVEEKMLSIVGFFLANSIQKKESEKQAREAEERVQLMLDATPLCCNLWTPELQNMTCNEEAARLFELSSQQEYLDRFFELSPQYQPCGRLSGEMAAEYVMKAFDEGFCKFEWLHQKVDGTPIPAEITLVRVKYKDGHIVAGYTRDLREHNAMLAQLQAKEDDLRAAMDEALLSSKAKSNFLANMSHEIRTPMNAISGFAEILIRESKDKQSAEYAIGIKNACSSLLNIINDILDISKIESGKLEIINAEYELSSLLNDAIAISRMRVGSKPLMFLTNIDSNLPAKLIGDEIRIKQILINLLSNAIKFTEAGHISLRVSGEIIDNKAKLRFDVSDTGFGIKKEDLKRLFAEFERINTTKNRSIEGTGLGLAISKQLCEMMGGKIQVESTYGEGSVFTVTIIQDCPKYAPLARVEKEKTVLLYEPREVHLNSITETIENLGCKCIPCETQSQLCKNIGLMPYDAILTSSIHLEKIKSLIQKNGLNSSVVIFADYGENIGDNSVRTIFVPINCLQISDVFNEQKNDNEFDSRNELSYNFIAPSARVLVVDDNLVNLKVATGLMLPYEFTIDTAENGIKAIEMVKKHKYDLVFMDHMMPEMDGIDATVAIRSLKGEYYRTLPIIALTANALVGTKEMFIRKGMNDFLAKPIEMSKLANILTKWLPNSKKIITSKSNVKNIDEEVLDFEISGLNVKKGISAIGGNKEDYMHILSIYYTDGINKLSSLSKHFNNKDILAFRTEVHALKSTSATIGAAELSTMAEKLENAATNQNIEYIKENFTEFLTALENILESIAPHINNSLEAGEKENSSTPLEEGDLTLLYIQIEKLHRATEFADINQIEEILVNLKRFSWADEISKELSSIENYVNMFDYDSITSCITAIENLKL